MIPVYAVVPSYGRESLEACLSTLLPQADLLFLVQTRPFPVRAHPRLVVLGCDPARELNISEWWNAGIDAAAAIAAGLRGGICHPQWNVLVVNDDVPPEQRRSRLAYEVLRGTKLATDVLVCTRSYFEARRHLRASLPGTVLREGLLLHAE